MNNTQDISEILDSMFYIAYVRIRSSIERSFRQNKLIEEKKMSSEEISALIEFTSKTIENMPREKILDMLKSIEKEINSFDLKSLNGRSFSDIEKNSNELNKLKRDVILDHLNLSDLEYLEVKLESLEEISDPEINHRSLAQLTLDIENRISDITKHLSTLQDNSLANEILEHLQTSEKSNELLTAAIAAEISNNISSLQGMLESDVTKEYASKSNSETLSEIVEQIIETVDAKEEEFELE